MGSESIFDKENAEILSAKFGTGEKAGTPKPEAKDGLKGKIKAQEQDELKSEEEQAAKDNEKLLKANIEAESKTALTGVDKSKAKLIIEAQKQLDADSAANENALKKAMDERAQYRRRIEQAGIELKQAKEENIHMFRQKFGVPQEQISNAKVSSSEPEVSTPAVSNLQPQKSVMPTSVKTAKVKSEAAESSEDAEVEMAKEEVVRDEQDADQGGVTMEQVVGALKKVVKSGSHAGLQKAEELLAKLDPTFKPSVPPTPENLQKRKNTYANEKVNFAKCVGEEHGKEGGTGKITCKPSKGSCPDTAGGKGVFVLTSLSGGEGSGFCAPWLNEAQN